MPSSFAKPFFHVLESRGWRGGWSRGEYRHTCLPDSSAGEGEERRRGVVQRKAPTDLVFVYPDLVFIHSCPMLYLHWYILRRAEGPVSTGAAGARALLQVRVNTSILPGSQFRLKNFFEEENLQLQFSFSLQGWTSWKPPLLPPDFQLSQRGIVLCHSLCSAPGRGGHSVPWTKTVRLEKAPQDWVIGLCEEERRTKPKLLLHCMPSSGQRCCPGPAPSPFWLMPRTCSFPSSCRAWGAAHIPQPARNTSCAWQAHLDL